jgi:hypothetical protein
MRCSPQNVEHRVEFLFINADVTLLQIDEPVDIVCHLDALARANRLSDAARVALKVGPYGTPNALVRAHECKVAGFLLASGSEVHGDPQLHPQRVGVGVDVTVAPLDLW